MIQFHQEDIELPKLDKKKISLWVEEVAASYGKKTGQINYIFCSEEKILEVNKQYLNHDYFTDIISFDYSSAQNISGDLFISPFTVASNAELLKQPFQRELHRVIIHGILHLCGFEDKTSDQQTIMRKEENKALELIDITEEERSS
ncbi:MAG: rRNA maturation RNase YbeY [Bacteroidales bacterium]|jgi:rRNA maturation RNase YbeY|nr:rRNA maturation RNase YbeY [Bacteroidales bacterium]MDD3431170.1 rRNA maturation RNase YbeY [Bacteroidales bacterium]MDD4361326.1 rRNA maturation RNase YbeY [Bacteroidales bacterium]MDD4431185.1 rRNA maturation RNase YbeY [Bacteroidales bacterium]